MSIEIQGNTGKLTLGDGSYTWVKRIQYGEDAKSGNPIMGFDFRHSPPCEHCGGHADERGFAEGGYQTVSFTMSGMHYRTEAACPHCVYGAFRNNVQGLAWPEQAKAKRDGQDQRDLDMASNPVYAPKPEKAAASVDRLAELIGETADGLGF